MSTTQRTHITKKYISPPPSTGAINFSIPLTSVADPDPYVFGPPGSRYGTISKKYGSGSFYGQAKIVRKTLIPTNLCLFHDFFYLRKL